MASSALYQEIQGVVSQKVTDLLKGLAVVFALCIGINLIKNGGNLDSFSNFLLVAFSVTAVGAFLSSYKLITEIRKEGVSVRFPPFQPGTNFYPWSNIDEIYIRQFNPLAEYNGWGIKTGVSGRSFTFSGNTGIQLLLKNGEKILIGTAQPEKVAEMLERLNRL